MFVFGDGGGVGFSPGDGGQRRAKHPAAQGGVVSFDDLVHLVALGQGPGGHVWEHTQSRAGHQEVVNHGLTMG